MDPFSALQVAASILQIIDIGIKVGKRLDEFRQKGNALPKSFDHLSKRIPILISALRKTEQGIGNMDESTRKAFTPAIEECLRQIEKLEKTLVVILPKQSDGEWTRSWKAFVSVKYDGQIKEFDRVIRDYMEVMAQHQVSSLALKNLGGPKLPNVPTSTCPLPRDKDFVERSVFAEVEARCVRGSRLALTGIGGVGKSQMAIELAYRTRTNEPNTWVFWVSAKSIQSIETDFRKIAKVVGLPGYDERDTDILSMVRGWLQDDHHGPWLMIIDNADDADILIAPHMKNLPPGVAPDPSTVPQIRSFLEISQNGSVLITSTNVHAAQLLTGNCAYHIEVNEMTEDEALSLLKSKLHTKVQHTEQEAKALVQAAEFMPLAISQIATHISLDYPRLTLPKATESLLHPAQDTTRLLESSVHESNRDMQRTNSIVKSWHMSFQYVSRTRPSAAKLLSLMCLFDRQGIPEALLTGQYTNCVENYGTHALAPHSSREAVRHRLRRLRSSFRKRRKNQTVKTEPIVESFEDDWRVLNNLMFIKTELNGLHFSMHRLIQWTTRRWLELEGTVEMWKEKYVTIIRRCFPDPDFDNWAIWQYLYPHAEQIVQYMPHELQAVRLWAYLLQSVAKSAKLMGMYETSVTMGRASLLALETSTNQLDERLRLLRCLHELGLTLDILGKHVEAEIYLRRARAGRIAVLGPGHSDTLDSTHKLGSALCAQGKHEEGNKYHQQSIAGQKVTHGPTHAEVQSSLGTLTLAKLGTGQLAQAESLSRDLHHIRQETLGDLAACDSMQALALVLVMQDKDGEAEELHRKVFEMREASDGLNNVETIKSLNFLGVVLMKQDKSDEAVALYTRVADVEAELEQGARAAALQCLDNLAQALLESNQQLERAESIARSIVASNKEMFGPDHYYVFASLHTLARTLEKQEKYGEACNAFQEAAVGTQEQLGVDHPDTRDFLNDLNAAKDRMLERMGSRDDTVAEIGTKGRITVGPIVVTTSESMEAILV